MGCVSNQHWHEKCHGSQVDQLGQDFTGKENIPSMSKRDRERQNTLDGLIYMTFTLVGISKANEFKLYCNKQ